MDEYLAPRQESQGPLQSGAFHHVDQPARPERLHAMPGRAELGGRTLRQRLHGDLPFADAGREKARHRADLEQLAAAHDADPVADRLRLGEHVARHENRRAPRALLAQMRAIYGVQS